MAYYQAVKNCIYDGDKVKKGEFLCLYEEHDPKPSEENFRIIPNAHSAINAVMIASRMERLN